MTSTEGIAVAPVREVAESVSAAHSTHPLVESVIAPRRSSEPCSGRSGRADALAERYLASFRWPEVGSEGYAPWLRKAIESGSPADALKAANLLSMCESVDAQIESLERYLPEAAASARPALTELKRMQGLEQSRCQTVTPDLLAQQHQLLHRAALAGEPGAAHAWASGLGKQRDPAQREQGLQLLRAAVAEHGDVEAIQMLGGPGWLTQGLSDVERRAYLLLLEAVVPSGMRGEGSAIGRHQAFQSRWFDEVFGSVRMPIAKEEEAQLMARRLREACCVPVSDERQRFSPRP